MSVTPVSAENLNLQKNSLGEVISSFSSLLLSVLMYVYECRWVRSKIPRQHSSIGQDSEELM